MTRDYFDGIKDQDPWSRQVGPEDLEEYRAAKLLASLVREEAWRLGRAVTMDELARALSIRSGVPEKSHTRPADGVPDLHVLTLALDRAKAFGLVRGRARLEGGMVWREAREEMHETSKKDGLEEAWSAGIP